MPTCIPKNPPEYRTLKACMKGTWHEKTQQLFVCDDLTTAWIDITAWLDTGIPCEE